MNCPQFVSALALAMTSAIAASVPAAEPPRGAPLLIQDITTPLPANPPPIHPPIKKLFTLAEEKQQAGLPGLIRFSPDGKVLAAVRGTDVVLWDVDKRQVLHVLSCPEYDQGFSPSVMFAAFLPPGDRLVTGRWRLDTSFLWDARSGKRLAEFDTGGKAPTAITMTGPAAFPDGKRVICCPTEGLVIWDVEAKTYKKFALQGYFPSTGGSKPAPSSPTCTSVVFSADGKRFATAVNDQSSDDAQILVWDTETCRVTRVIPLGRAGNSCKLTLAPDGSNVAAVYRDNTYYRVAGVSATRSSQIASVWSAVSGRCMLRGAPFDGGPTGIAFTRDGKYLEMSGHDDGFSRGLKRAPAGTPPPMVGERERPPIRFADRVRLPEDTPAIGVLEVAGDRGAGPTVVGVWEVATGKLVSAGSMPDGRFWPDNKFMAAPNGYNIDIYAVEYAEQAKKP